MTPAFFSPRFTPGRDLFFRETAMTPANRVATLAGRFVLAAAMALPVFAQPPLVTELQGPASRQAAAAERPVAVLETLAAGERLRIPARSRATVFVPGEAALYEIAGPAEILVTPGEGLSAVSGELPAPRRLHEAYRNLRVDAPNIAQGGLILRNESSRVALVSPVGVVSASSARHFQWKAESGLEVRIELATGDGAALLQAAVSTGELRLPEWITLQPGRRYTWGVFLPSAPDSPVDWTDFLVAAAAEPVPGPPGDSRSERSLYAAWLFAKGLPRASIRALGEQRP